MNFAFNSNSVNTRKAGRKKTGPFSFVFIFFIGILFFATGIATFRSSKIDPSWTRVTGQVVGYNTDFNNSGNGGTNYTSIIEYKAKGQTYHISGNTGSTSIPTKGNPAPVAYDPSEPANAKEVNSGTTRALFLLFPLAGLVIIIGAVTGLIRSSRRSHDINDLTQRGQKVQGVIVDIQTMAMNTGMNVGNNANSLSNYKVVVAATGPGGQVQNYTSDTLSGIGGLAMMDFRANPIPLDVYIDPVNPSNYYVDVSQLPSLTPDRIMGLVQSAASATQYHSVVPGQSPGIAAAPSNTASNPVSPPPAPQTSPLPAPQPQTQVPPVINGSQLPPPYTPAPPQSTTNPNPPQR